MTWWYRKTNYPPTPQVYIKIGASTINIIWIDNVIIDGPKLNKI